MIANTAARAAASLSRRFKKHVILVGAPNEQRYASAESTASSEIWVEKGFRPHGEGFRELVESRPAMRFRAIRRLFP